jgi:hypothetical protein
MSWSHTSKSPTVNMPFDQTQTSPQDPSTLSNPAQSSPRFASYNDPFAQQGPHVQDGLSSDISDLNIQRSQGQRIGGDEHLQVDEAQEAMSILQAPLQNGNINSMNTPTTWYQSNFTSINWLPEDWTPDLHNVENGTSMEAFDHQQILMFSNNIQSDFSGVENGAESSTTTRLMTRPRQKENPLVPLVQMDSQDLSSPGSHSTHSGGRYYVDGDGARLPRVKKAPYRHSDSYSHAFHNDYRTSHPTFAFPGADADEYHDSLTNSLPIIPANVYSEIFRIFSLTCVSSTQYPHFQGNSIPSLYVLSRFVNNYTQNFRTILPFTHPSTFDISTTHWLLTLAMAAIGSHYSDSPGAETTTTALHEFLRRSILTVVRYELL